MTYFISLPRLGFLAVKLIRVRRGSFSNAEKSRNPANVKSDRFLNARKNISTNATASTPLITRKVIAAAFRGIIRTSRQRAILPPSSGYAGRTLIKNISALAENTVSVNAYVSGKNHHSPAHAVQISAFTSGPATASLISSIGEIPSVSHDAAAPYGMRLIFSHM